MANLSCNAQLGTFSVLDRHKTYRLNLRVKDIANLWDAIVIGEETFLPYLFGQPSEIGNHRDYDTDFIFQRFLNGSIPDNIKPLRYVIQNNFEIFFDDVYKKEKKFRSDQFILNYKPLDGKSAQDVEEAVKAAVPLLSVLCHQESARPLPLATGNSTPKFYLNINSFIQQEQAQDPLFLGEAPPASNSASPLGGLGEWWKANISPYVDTSLFVGALMFGVLWMIVFVGIAQRPGRPPTRFGVVPSLRRQK